MIFKTISDLNNDIINNIHKFPQDLDLIVGVPRSGTIVASIISVYLNKPLLDIDSFQRRNIGSAGQAKKHMGWKTRFEDVRKVLVVEDSVNSGNSIKSVKDKFGLLFPDIEILYLGAYVTRELAGFVDIYFDVCEHPRAFEWNYMHSYLLVKACVDIDGVLCLDPSNEENDDGERYKKFLENTQMKLIPSQKIGWLVTSRLEKYRTETESWLERHGIEYENLVMIKCETADERRLLGKHGDFKAEIFGKEKNAIWFIESDPGQAEIIANKTRKLVFCVGNQTLYGANSKKNVLQNNKANIKKAIKSKLPKSVVVMIKKIIK